MAFPLPRLHNAYDIEQAVIRDPAKVTCLRFGQDYDQECMKMDEVLFNASRAVEGACSIFAVNTREACQGSDQFQFVGNLTMLVFFFRGRHLQLDVGNNIQPGVSWAFSSQQEFLDLVEAVYRGATQGRDVILAPKDYSIRMGY
mmetsp:Transcript_14556/g.31892  ORF Transcript_14556/g.31892 Transcript_14556/m.31892 type:complete len:144 (+) Transcript_14556:64-495(+)